MPSKKPQPAPSIMSHPVMACAERALSMGCESVILIWVHPQTNIRHSISPDSMSSMEVCGLLSMVVADIAADTGDGDDGDQ
jgi:hypothetical protein